MMHLRGRKEIRRKPLQRRGTTAVEFALVFPVAMLFFVSLITLVQSFIIRNAAENAAYFGARRGIIPGATDQSIRNVIQEEVQLGLTSEFTANINRLGESVTVTVTIPLKGNAWVTGGFAPEIFSITQSCTLRKQDE
jgi:Flp pilus assembly protein TadG